MFFENGEVHIEEEDQCFSCEHFRKGVKCPLLEALAERVVFLEGDILVRNCGFYREFKRHLTVVKPEETSEQDKPQAEEVGEVRYMDEKSRRSFK